MYKKFDLLFGFFVIIVFIWFLWVLFSSFITSDIKTYKLRVSFSSADGISRGSDVKIAGVKIGEVSDVVANNKTFNADVSLKVYSKFKLPVDSSAIIQSSGIMGGKYIELAPGVEADNLKEGDKIKYTQSSLNLEKLIGSFANGGGASSSNKK